MSAIRRFTGLAIAALLIGTVSLAQAQTQWNPAVATGNWSIATNWVGGVVPNSTADSLINNGGTAVIDSTSTGYIGGEHIYLGDSNGTRSESTCTLAASLRVGRYRLATPHRGVDSSPNTAAWTVLMLPTRRTTTRSNLGFKMEVSGSTP